MWVALLRGINVGGKHKLPMKDLANLFESCGAREVRTYIQSGNVIFDAASGAARIAEKVGAAIADRWGYDVPVVTRRGAELARIVRGLPFRRADPARLCVAFLDRKPTAAKLALLDPDRSPPDRFVAVGREIYLHLPNGVARTKLTNRYLDSTLGAVSTVRNWKTVRKLSELSGG